MIYINRFFFGISDQLRKFYLNSNLYDKKISKVNEDELLYKPSPYLLSSLIKYQKKKFDIEIDGGINFENSKKAIEAGANILVSGTTIFKSNNGDVKKNIELLKSK